VTAIRPFRALRYDPTRVDLSRVLVPPYDVIAPDEREAFFARDPHNAIRLELTRDARDEATTDYAQVAEVLAEWRSTGVLVRDSEPALYGLRQRFRGPDGRERVREGFFAELHLEDYDRRIVRPHERTLAGPKADRLKLLRATRANLSVVFLLYEDREHAVAAALARAFAAAPLARGVDPAGVDTTLVRVGEPSALARVRELLAGWPVVIADGHHRYETALAYRDERRAAAGTARGAGDAPHEWVLAYFANAFAPGTLLLPIHRVILKGPPPAPARWRERLAGWRCTEHALAGAEAVPGALAAHLAPLADRHAFAADDGSGILRVFSRPRVEGELCIRVLHGEVIEGVFGLDAAAVREGAVGFPKDAVRAARDVREGRGAVALYLNPLSPEDVFRVTGAGELLPQKSTFFLPKLPTGLVFRPLDDGGPAR
jgi:uncharacterized protein (DUF1015 family)